MALVFKITQGGSTLVDLADSTKYRLADWNPTFDSDAPHVVETITFHVIGSTIDALHTNFTTLYRAILAVQSNAQSRNDGTIYTPTLLAYQWDAATYQLQSEIIDASALTLQNYFAQGLQRFFVRAVQIRITRQPFFEETSQQSLAAASAINNNGAALALSGARGDMPAPLYVRARTSLASQRRLIVGLKQTGTVANFVSKYEAESYTARGSNVADLTAGATFSGSSTNAQRWTPSGATTLQRLLLWNITSNVADQTGVYGIYARVRDNKATPVVRIRARAHLYDGTNYTAGEYGDTAKACVTANATIELVYCGVLALPPVDSANEAPNGFALELLGECDASPSTFDIDCVYLIPLAGVGRFGAAGVVRMPTVAGTGALPDMVLDAHDRKPRGYLETTAGAVLTPAVDVRGNGVFLLPNTSAQLYVLTTNSSTGAHDYTGTNTVTVSTSPRYHLLRGA